MACSTITDLELAQAGVRWCIQCLVRGRTRAGATDLEVRAAVDEDVAVVELLVAQQEDLVVVADLSHRFERGPLRLLKVIVRQLRPLLVVRLAYLRHTVVDQRLVEAAQENSHSLGQQKRRALAAALLLLLLLLLDAAAAAAPVVRRLFVLHRVALGSGAAP